MTAKSLLVSAQRHRFYHLGKGIHFYTADEIEAATVIEKSIGSGYSLSNAVGIYNLLDNGWGYAYEGIAWYAADA